MNANAPLLFVVYGADPALLDLLQEMAAYRPQLGFTVKPAKTFDDVRLADVALFSASSEEAMADACSCAERGRNENPQQARLLVIDRILPEEDEGFAGLFHGVFKKPLHLAMLLDAGVTNVRLLRARAQRTLSGKLVFDPLTRALKNESGDALQHLSAREAAFLLAVVEAGEKGLSRAQAVTDVWGFHRDVDSHAVETTVYRLRQKLQGVPDCAAALVSENGIYFWKSA